MAEKQNMPNFINFVVQLIMTPKAEKIPKQLFVTCQKANKFPLGFLHEYSPHTTGGQKKMKTQTDWAYVNSSTIQVVEENGVWYRRGFSHQYFNVGGLLQAVQVPVDEIIDQSLAPRIWDNVPLEGFTISTTVSRYSTSNKLWRIIDPRGVEFEITTENFEDLVMNTTIKQGEILSPCVWVKNKHLALAI